MEDQRQSFYDELVGLLKGDCPSYKAIFGHSDFIVDMAQEKSDYNVYIPVRGRQTFLEPCIQYLNRSAAKACIAISVVVIENDVSPHYRDLARALGVSYIFLPVNVSSSDGLFAKSLCYNIGFIKAKRTKWNIFHDLDMLVEEDFFEKLGVHLKSNPNWLQPYKGHSVMRLSSDATAILVENPKKYYDLAALEGTTISDPPCPGGSIVVNDTDFIKVGGYDPEYFYGYAPEDTFFWEKLELLYKNHMEPIRSHLLGGASYANDPPIDVYHMHHELQESANPNLKVMQAILSFFNVLNNKDRVFLLQLKRNILESALYLEGRSDGNM
jgi:hypothetical protein